MALEWTVESTAGQNEVSRNKTKIRFYLIIMIPLLLSTIESCETHELYESWCDGNKIKWKNAGEEDVHMGCSDPIHTLGDCADYNAKCKEMEIDREQVYTPHLEYGNKSARCVFKNETCPEGAKSVCVDNIIADCIENSPPSFRLDLMVPSKNGSFGNERCGSFYGGCDYFEEYNEARCFEESEIPCTSDKEKKCHEEAGGIILECLEGKWTSQSCWRINEEYSSCVDNGTGEVICR